MLRDIKWDIPKPDEIKDLAPEIVDLINDNFWELFGDEMEEKE